MKSVNRPKRSKSDFDAVSYLGDTFDDEIIGSAVGTLNVHIVEDGVPVTKLDFFDVDGKSA